MRPCDKKITTRNIPKAFDAPIKTGGRFLRSTRWEIIKYPNPTKPTARKTPYIIRLLIIALFNLSLIENSPASSYYWAIGSKIHVRKKMRP